MQTVTDIAIRLSLFYVFILLGFLTMKFAPRADSFNKVVTQVLIYILLPILIINTLLSAASQTLAEFPLVIGFVILIHFLGIIIMLLRMRNSDIPSPTRGSILLCVAFNNAIFIPVPLILMFIGDIGVPIVAFYSIGQMILLATLGTLIGSVYGRDGTNRLAMIKKALLFPPFISSMIGILLAIFGFSVPIEIQPVIGTSNTITTYLALFAVGLGIGAKVTMSHIRTAIETVAVRQFIVPIVVFLVLLVIPVTSVTRAILVLQAMMPAAVITVIFATALELDSEMAATIVTLGTLLLLPVVPIIPLLIW